jgi:hypothetical protein
MNNFLKPDQCLVYLEADGSTSEISGYTHIARVIRKFYDHERLWYEVRLETDKDGKSITVHNNIFVTSDHIISDRAYIPIEIKSFYHYSNNGITAENFVIKSDRTNPLTSTSRTALGSGIFGTRTANYNSSLKSYLITIANAYEVQDAAHGDAITLASSITNGFIDGILAILAMPAEQDDVGPLDITNAINSVDYSHLVVLWNIVFYRTLDIISGTLLGQLLSQYIYKYLQVGALRDSITTEEIVELPINSIMRALNYDGLIAVDPYNNGWDRGSINYNYGDATQLIGSTRKDRLY